MEKKQTGVSVKRFRSRPRAPILITESGEEFDNLLNQLEREIEPQGVLEKMLVESIAQTVWEIRRYQRVKPGIINTRFKNALQRLLEQAGLDSDSEESQELAERWFTEPAAKQEVTEELRQIGLDESAIEAEAVRSCVTGLESCEEMIGLLESRFRVALALIDQLRDGSLKLRRRSDRRVEAEGIVRLPSKSSRA